MARTTRLAIVVAAAMLVTGCATSAAPGQEAAPEPSHTMPDGTAMSGAEHDDQAAHASSDGEPSPAAQMICAGQVVGAVTGIFGLDADAVGEPSWDAPMYTCTYEIDGAPVVLSVHDTADAAAGQEHFDATQEGLGAERIEGMLGLGLPSFSTGDGIVGFLRDGKTLTVDATALPAGFGDGSRTQDGAAYALASAVLTCWIEHD